MRPLPLAASDLSPTIAEKSLVNDVALMLAPAAAEVDDPDAAAVVGEDAAVVADTEVDFELLHAARPATAKTAAVTPLTRLSEALMLPPILFVVAWRRSSRKARRAARAPSRCTQLCAAEPPPSRPALCRACSPYGNLYEQGVEVRPVPVNDP